MKILITGAAGFIGFHLVKLLLKSGHIEVIGLDNINPYYDVRLKYDRLKECGIERNHIIANKTCKSKLYSNYTFYKSDISDYAALKDIFIKERVDIVINLAAQAGVRYSMENPDAYVTSNILGFVNILECCRHHQIKHLIYASSSSVYGSTNKVPFTESDNVDYPVSIYAATKKSNELLAHTYSHLFQLPTTGVRLFTVYGPWGRPDMAPMLFANAIKNNQPISLFNHGDMWRDFTYVEDVAKGIAYLSEFIPDINASHPFYEIYNIGHSSPVQLLDFVHTMESVMDKKANLQMSTMQPGDVMTTFADTRKLMNMTGYKPTTTLSEGVEEFVRWFLQYYAGNHEASHMTSV